MEVRAFLMHKYTGTCTLGLGFCIFTSTSGELIVHMGFYFRDFTFFYSAGTMCFLLEEVIFVQVRPMNL